MKKLFSDSKVCTGCRSCEAICSYVHSDGECNPYQARIRVHLNLLHGESKPSVCQQCPKPKCLKACPAGAIQQDPTLGIPRIDAGKCDLCRACIEACPFGAIFFDEKAKTLLVCDLCGGDPMCVKFCRHFPHKTHAALGYMEPKEWSKRIHAPSRETQG